MARITWHRQSKIDVKRLLEFLQTTHPEAAKRAARTIVEGARLLESSPRLGRPLADGTERRELVLSFGSGAYILRYILEDETTVVVLRVRHSKEQRMG